MRQTRRESSTRSIHETRCQARKRPCPYACSTNLPAIPLCWSSNLWSGAFPNPYKRKRQPQKPPDVTVKQYGGTTMKVKMHLKKRIISALLCLALMLTYFPLSAAAAAAEAVGSFDRVVDNNTMNNWTKYFDLDDLNTANAGGVWTDKSVFTDASVFDGKISMIDDEKNFLTALSTLAANKEVVGYSTIPTDTVLVLDLSNSMPTGARTQLIEAANNAIKQLQEANKNNRVGVVLYAGDDNGTYAFIVGNGTGTSARKNAFAIDPGGRVIAYTTNDTSS
ncbi:MAG: VWA domain-containing protein, partial [Ruminococcaceae bacterium]|nr:VWA domain-containing protein [Oscillospiraceae bacterium]